MNWQLIGTGIGALIATAGGCILVIRELTRRDRRAIRQEVSDLATEVADLRHDLLACRAFSFRLAEQLSTRGIEVPEPPEMRTDHRSDG